MWFLENIVTGEQNSDCLIEFIFLLKYIGIILQNMDKKKKF